MAVYQLNDIVCFGFHFGFVDLGLTMLSSVFFSQLIFVILGPGFAKLIQIDRFGHGALPLLFTPLFHGQ